MIDPIFLYIIIAASLCCGVVIGYILHGLFRKNAKPETQESSGMPLEADDLDKTPQDHHYKKGYSASKTSYSFNLQKKTPPG